MALTKDQLIDEIEQMSVLDLAELVKSLEEEFGVSAAAAPVMMAGPAGAGGGDGAAAAEEQTEFDVVLNAAGDKKIQVIKVVRERHRPGPQGGQGPRRRRAEGRQGGRHPRGGRQGRGRAPGSRRVCRSEIGSTRPDARAGFAGPR